MSSLLISAILLGLAAVAAFFVAFRSLRTREDPRFGELSKSLSDLLRQTAEARGASDALAGRMESFERTVGERINQGQQLLSKSIDTMQKQSADGTRLIKDVGEKLGVVFEATKAIQGVAGDITRLEDLLKPPKLRGTLGETFLEEALRQVLPAGSYKMQHRFTDGEAVDAAIVVGGRLVPIDSKFPLENFRRSVEGNDEAEKNRARREFARDVKKHVDAIAAKYIRVSEGTFDFALMYVPAEAVYAEIAAGADEGPAIADYAIGKKVIPVSPRLLYAYLFTVAQGLRGMEIEQHALEILEELAALRRGVDRIEDPMGKLGTHLANASKQYEETRRELTRFSDRLREVADSDVEIAAPPPLKAIP